MRSLLLLFLFILSSLWADENFAVKGEGWQAWKHLEKTILEFKEVESLNLCSGRMREGIHNFGMENIVKETKAMQPKFIREFTNKEKDTLYLITEIQGRDTALIFKKENNIWLFDDQTPGNFTLPEEAEKWREIAMLKSLLDQIARQTALYFSDPRESLSIPPPGDMGINPKFTHFLNPETKKAEKFLIVQGVNYQGSSQLLLAVSPTPVFGKYYACFEDGKIRIIGKQFFDLNIEALGLEEKSQALRYDDKTFNKLNQILKNLSTGNYKERKKAKLELTTLGPMTIPFLLKHKDHQELELKLTVQEILDDFEGKAYRTRPKYQP